METEKLSLKSIKNVLSRAEMKKITAGSGLQESTCWHGTPFGGEVAFSCPASSYDCMLLCVDDWGDYCYGCAQVIG